MLRRESLGREEEEGTEEGGGKKEEPEGARGRDEKGVARRTVAERRRKQIKLWKRKISGYSQTPPLQTVRARASKFPKVFKIFRNF
jgi:hypothetical protein